jgi:hypothetical protein
MFMIPSGKNEGLYGVFHLSIERAEGNLILPFDPEGGEDEHFRCCREKGDSLGR